MLDGIHTIALATTHPSLPIGPPSTEMTSAIAVSEYEYKETKREYDDNCLATPKFHDQAPHLRQNYMMQKQYTEKKDDILKGLKNMSGEVRRSLVYHVCAYWTCRANAGLFADMGAPPPHHSASPLTESSSLTLSGTPPTSITNSPGLTIPTFVTLSFPTQPLTISTNLTFSVLT